jgi:hypothetical protein
MMMMMMMIRRRRRRRYITSIDLCKHSRIPTVTSTPLHGSPIKFMKTAKLT